MLADLQPTGGLFNFVLLQTTQTALTLYDQNFVQFVYQLLNPFFVIQAPEPAFILIDDIWHRCTIDMSKLLHPGQIDVQLLYDEMAAVINTGGDPWQRAPLALAQNFTK